MAAVNLAQNTTITYGSLTVGGAGSGPGATYRLAGPFSLEIDHDRGRLSFEIVLANGPSLTLTDSLMAQHEQALRDAFRTPDQALTIELGSSTRHSFNPASNTGFNLRPEIEGPLEGEDNTDRSARYRVTIGWELPADRDSRAGRRVARFSVDTAANGRRQVEVTGAWTAVGPNGAIAQYKAQSESYCQDYLDAVSSSATWQLVRDQFSPDENNKVLEFTRVYEELTHNESLNVLDDPALRHQRLMVMTDELGPEVGSNQAVPPVELRVVYAAEVDRDVTTDLTTVWATKVFPHLRNELARVAAGGQLALVQASPSYDWPNNGIAGVISARLFRGSIVLEEREVRDRLIHGVQFVPLADGKTWSFVRYGGVPLWLRTVTLRQIRLIGGGLQGPATGPILRLPGGGGGGLERLSSIQPEGGFHVLEEDVVSRDFFEGIPGSRVSMQGRVEVVHMFRADVTVGGGGGGGRGASAYQAEDFLRRAT